MRGCRNLQMSARGADEASTQIREIGKALKVVGRENDAAGVVGKRSDIEVVGELDIDEIESAGQCQAVELRVVRLGVIRNRPARGDEERRNSIAQRAHRTLRR